MSFVQQLEIAQGLSSAIRNELQKLDSLTGADRQNADSKIEGMLNNLQTKIGSLRGQLNSIREDREMYAEELQDLEKDRSDIQTELKRKRAIYAQNAQNQQIHDQNMATGNQILNNFDEALAIGDDTLKTQENTKNTLAEDQQHLDNITTNLSLIETEAETGTQRANRMIKRQLIQRIISWGVFLILLAFFIFSLWYKLH